MFTTYFRALLLIPFLSLGSALAGINTWTSLNLYGGYVQTLAIDPQNTCTVYIGTADGIFRTTDRGKSWIARSSGLGRVAVNALAIDPQVSGTIYAGTEDSGVLKSIDGGASWNASAPVTSTYNGFRITALAIDPQNHTTVYAGSYAGLFKSTDGGATWQSANSGLPNNPNAPAVGPLSLDPQNPGTIYAGAYGGVFKSTDGGGSWNGVNANLCCALGGGIAIAAAKSGIVYVLADGLWKSTDGGGSWVNTGLGLTLNHGYGALAVDPENPDTIFVTIDGTVFRSIDGGVSWSTGAYMGIVSGYIVTSVTVDPRSPNIVYATTQNTGVYQSIDGGVNWSAANSGITALNIDLMAIDPQNSGTLYAASEPGLMFKTTDGGQNWRAGNWEYPPSWVASLVVSPQAPSTLYAGTVGDPDFGGSGAIFKSADWDSEWSLVTKPPVVEGLPVTEALSVNSLLFDPQNTSTAYAAIGGINLGWGLIGVHGGVLKSTDGGLSWVAVNSGLPAKISIRTLAIDPQNNGTLYAGTGADLQWTAPDAVSGGVFKSTDGGGSWNASSFGLPGDYVSVLLTEPRNSGAVYALTGSGVFKTADGGLSWNSANTGLPATGVSALAMDPQNPNTLYAAAPNGVFRSTDGAKSWTALNYPGWPMTPVLQLSFGVQIPAALYAVTNGGIYAISFAPIVLLSLSGDGQGQGAILHAGTNQVASATNPAAAGEALEIYCTGLSSGPAAALPQVTIGGVPAEILFAGYTPGFANLNQVNIRVPSGITSGAAVAVRLINSGVLSNEVTIGVK